MTNDLEQVQANPRRVTIDEPVPIYTAIAGEFRAGQQIQINNSINHVHFRKVTNKEIFGVVDRLSIDRIGSLRGSQPTEVIQHGATQITCGISPVVSGVN